MPPRFYVDAPLVAGAAVSLPDDVAHHAVRVLRLRDGAAIALFNGRGGEYAARLTLAGAHATARLERFDAVERESPLALTLVQSWLANDKLDWIVEKAVELGATAIVLVPARRSVVVLDSARRAKREQRLRDIVVAACCQCGRNRVPALHAAATLEDGLRHALRDGARGLVLDPGAGHSLPAAAGDAAALALTIGPEGGFEAGEIDLARRAGFTLASFGRRILRTETAGLAALAALQAVRGDLR